MFVEQVFDSLRNRKNRVGAPMHLGFWGWCFHAPRFFRVGALAHLGFFAYEVEAPVILAAYNTEKFVSDLRTTQKKMFRTLVLYEKIGLGPDSERKKLFRTRMQDRKICWGPVHSKKDRHLHRSFPSKG